MVRTTLEQFGVAFIPNLLNDAECEAMNSGMWNTLNHLSSSPIQQTNPESWRVVQQFHPLRSGILQFNGIGHAQYVWDVRQNPKVTQVFANFWGEEDLLMSFDRVTCLLPTS